MDKSEEHESTWINYGHVKQNKKNWREKNILEFFFPQPKYKLLR